MKKRRPMPAKARIAKQHEVGTSSGHYRAGYEAGYALGLRLGQEDRGGAFEGTSIIIPTDPHHDAVVQAIEQILLWTSHPYEILVADAGTTTNARRYIHERRGAVRHIRGTDRDHVSIVVNKAIRASLGEYIAVLGRDAPIMDDWLEVMIRELEREPALKVVYASSAPAGMIAEAPDGEKQAQPVIRPGSQVSCLLFRRSVPDRIGLWEEEIRTLDDHMQGWLERIPMEQRLRIEATPVFASGKS